MFKDSNKPRVRPYILHLPLFWHTLDIKILKNGRCGIKTHNIYFHFTWQILGGTRDIPKLYNKPGEPGQTL